MKTMKHFCLLACFLSVALFAVAGEKSKTSFYKLSFTSIDGETIDFAQFKGKKVLIVNTASHCGFTPQYADLQELSKLYDDKLVVIGFPSGDFKEQELGTDAEIREFCTKTYDVTFLLMTKSNVIGKAQNPVFKWLTDKNENGWNNEAPTWNFCKYLVDEHGNLQKFFLYNIKPLDNAVISEIEK